MMEFIMMTASTTLAIFLASALGFLIMTNKKVMKWYMKYVMKSMNEFEHSLENDSETKDL